MTGLLRSPELRATLTAITDALVPERASRALVLLSDPRERRREACPTDSDASLPLAAGDAVVGRLYLFGPRFDTRGPFAAAFAELAAAALSNALAFERERHVALTFQNAALASSMPESAAYRFDSYYQPGKTEALVGGDWFDAFPLADGRIVISVGDVLGSGLDAAIAMVNVRQTIRGVAQIQADPAYILEAADRTLHGQYPDRFATAFVGVLDPVTQRCTFANAGHPPPLILHADRHVSYLTGQGVPLGLGVPGSDFCVDVHDAELPPSSLLVLYTDGLIESTHDVVEGENLLERALIAAATEDPAHVARYLHDAVLGDAAADDVAILAVTVRDGPVRRKWRFDPLWHDAARRVRQELDSELERLGMGRAFRANAELVFSEIVGNALRYAPGTLEVIVERNAAGITLHVLDRGPGYDADPHLPADLYSERGRGLFLVASLADHFVVERRPGGGSHARIVFRYRPAPPLEI